MVSCLYVFVDYCLYLATDYECVLCILILLGNLVFFWIIFSVSGGVAPTSPCQDSASCRHESFCSLPTRTVSDSERFGKFVAGRN